MTSQAVEEAKAMFEPPKQLWRVEVEITKRAPVYVLAETEEQAEKDAEELLDETMWAWDEDTDYFARRITVAAQIPGDEKTCEVWTGGEDGKDIPMKKALEILAHAPAHQGGTDGGSDG